MNIGNRYSLAWKFPHRVEATIVALEADYIVTESLHRCGFGCELGKMLGGELRYRYDDFFALFVPMAENAIPLGPAQ